MYLAGQTWIPDGDEYFRPYFEGCDVFEGNNLETGLSFVKEWECAVDGGAHVGSWSRALATKFKHVYSFEPQTENFLCLLRNTSGFTNVQPRRMALGSRYGFASLEPGNNSGCWHISEGSGVNMMPLDEFRPLRTLKVGYLKLDVEGYERFALEGARNLLRRCKPVVQIEEKVLSHSYEGGTARDLLETMDYVEVARSGRDVVFTWG